MSTLSEYTDDGWLFEGECYAVTKNYMRIGSNSGLGAVITPELRRSGNFTLLIKAKYISGFTGKFRVSVVGEGTVSSTEYTVISGVDEYRPSAILIKGCTPTSRLKIEGTSGKFYVLSIKVYSIGDGIYYESFNYMEGTGNTPFSNSTSSPYATNTKCDNTTTSLAADVNQTYQSIYLININSCYFQMPSVPDIVTGQRYILTFRLAGGVDNNSPKLKVALSGEGQLSPFNSLDLTDLASERSKNLTSSDYHNWTNCQLIITGMTSSTRISIYGEYTFIDDVMLSAVPTVTLDQGVNNTETINANVGLRNVQLVRTLAADTWVPLCLPFDVNYTSMAAAVGHQVELATLSSADGGIFQFGNVDESATIAAGKPFLAKVQSQTAVVNPEFHEVALTNTPSSAVTFGNYKLVGTYGPVELATNGTQLFLGTDGKLYIPNVGHNTLGGLRAYFVIPSGGGSARLFTPDGEQNGIAEVSSGEAPAIEVDLLGRKTASRTMLRLRIDPVTGRKTLMK